MKSLRASLRLLCAAVILSIISSIAAAQDAGQVLRVSVGYGTLKNSVQVSPEKKAEVERIEALARKAGCEVLRLGVAADSYEAVEELREIVEFLKSPGKRPGSKPLLVSRAKRFS